MNKACVKFVLFLALALPVAAVLAQARTNLRGTIELVMLDEQYMIVDGQRLAVREADLVVTYNGAPLRASLLTQGMTMIYSTHADGSVAQITLIGPATLLDELNKH